MPSDSMVMVWVLLWRIWSMSSSQNLDPSSSSSISAPYAPFLSRSSTSSFDNCCVLIHAGRTVNNHIVAIHLQVWTERIRHFGFNHVLVRFRAGIPPGQPLKAFLTNLPILFSTSICIASTKVLFWTIKLTSMRQNFGKYRFTYYKMY